MDPSSPYAMQRLIGLKDRFDIAFACDTDDDRHGIVTRSAGPAAAQPLSGGRHPLPLPASAELAPGSGGRQDGGEQQDDRPRHREAGPQALRGAGRVQVVRRRLARRLARLRRRGERRALPFCAATATVWTTDKDGIVPALLAAEITARTGRDPGELYAELTHELGEPAYERIDAPATAGAEAAARGALAAAGAMRTSWPARRSRASSRSAPGNGAPIGGLKVSRRERLVRRAPLRHRGHLQDLRRELSRAEPPASHRGGGAGDRGRRAWGARARRRCEMMYVV